MFNIFKKKKEKEKYINPYTLPNIKRKFIGRNIMDFLFMLEKVNANTDYVYSIDISYRSMHRMDYYSNSNGELHDDIMSILEKIDNLLYTLDKRISNIKDISIKYQGETVLSRCRENISDVITL